MSRKACKLSYLERTDTWWTEISFWPLWAGGSGNTAQHAPPISGDSRFFKLRAVRYFKNICFITTCPYFTQYFNNYQNFWKLSASRASSQVHAAFQKYLLLAVLSARRTWQRSRRDRAVGEEQPAPGLWAARAAGASAAAAGLRPSCGTGGWTRQGSSAAVLAWAASHLSWSSSCG